MITGNGFGVKQVMAAACLVLLAYIQPCLAGAMGISAGDYHGLGLSSNGNVFAWGNNTKGQLGDGSNTDTNTPVPIETLSGIVSVDGGEHFSLALKQDGTVLAWGYNIQGQLGDGTTTDRNQPALVPGMSGCVAIAAGVLHSLALMGDGSIKAWGGNSSGQLGNGTKVSSYSPITVPGLSGVVAIGAGDNVSFAIKSDGSLWAWGKNSNGQLGDGTVTERTSPVQITGITGVAAVSCYVGHTLALKSDGTVWAWGNNSSGQLGNGNTVSSSVPIQVHGISGASAIGVGFSYSIALIGGHVWTWGSNTYGQLGNNTYTSSTSPIQVTAIDHVLCIAAGRMSTLVLKDNGSVWGWGYNVYGTLGDGTTSERNLPAQTKGVGGEGFLNLLVQGGYAYYLPYYYRYGENYTSIALRNLTADSTATVCVTAYDQDGTTINDGSLELLTIPARGQMATILPESSVSGWVEILSNQPLAGLCFVGKLKGTPSWPWTMSDISLLSSLATQLIVPHVAEDASWDTAVFLCNPKQTATSLTLAFIDAAGNALYSQAETIPARGSGVYFLSDLVPQGTPYSQGSVEITASQGVAGFAMYYDTIKKGGTCSAGISTVPVQ
ncbi:MAG: hypothetical protein V1793_00825 [Pseudomonadota bacterium]